MLFPDMEWTPTTTETHIYSIDRRDHGSIDWIRSRARRWNCRNIKRSGASVSVTKRNSASRTARNQTMRWETMRCVKVTTARVIKCFLVNRVENQKLNQTTAELPFG